MYQLKKLQPIFKKGEGEGRSDVFSTERKKNTFDLTLLHVKHHPQSIELNKPKEK